MPASINLCISGESKRRCGRFSTCGRTIEKGEFIAASTPIGRADKILSDIGQIYCEDCLPMAGEMTRSASS